MTFMFAYKGDNVGVIPSIELITIEEAIKVDELPDSFLLLLNDNNDIDIAISVVGYHPYFETWLSKYPISPLEKYINSRAKELENIEAERQKRLTKFRLSNSNDLLTKQDKLNPIWESSSIEELVSHWIEIDEVSLLRISRYIREANPFKLKGFYLLDIIVFEDEVLISLTDKKGNYHNFDLSELDEVEVEFIYG